MITWERLAAGMSSNSVSIGEEHQFFGGKARAQYRIGHASLPEHDYVLRVESLVPQAVVERKRKVLVEEKLHAACTAGGWCAAT